MIKREIIDKVRESVDIIEVIGSYLPLKRVGKYYRALCPFHSERSPSFYVSPDRQLYHCFGCGASGNAITFLMEYEKISFPEAVKRLAKRLGIEIEKERIVGKDEPLYRVCELACRFFENNLKLDRPRGYLNTRGLKESTIRKFRLGYAPPGSALLRYAREKGIDENLLVKAGLASKGEEGLFDWFRDRITFPVFSLSGRVIGFGARVIEEKEPKYINSPETEIFKKGENLYGLFLTREEIRRKGSIIVEGNFDLLSLYDKGIRNVVAPLGTSLTPDQASLLKRYNPNTILIFDPDPSGLKAAERAIELLLQAGLEVKIVRLPEGFDPDSYIREFSTDEFLKRVDEGKDFIDFLFDIKTPRQVSEKAELTKEIARMISKIPDEVRAELYLGKLSEKSGVEKKVLRFEERHPKIKEKAKRRSDLKRRLISVMLQDREKAVMAKEILPLEIFEDEALREIAGLIFNNPQDPADLIMRTESIKTRKLLAELTFERIDIPKDAFLKKIKTLRESWLGKKIRETKDEKEKNRLIKELTQLKKETVKKEG